MQMFPPYPTEPVPIVARVAWHLLCLARSIGLYGPKTMADRPLFFWLDSYIRRTERRFLALYARFEAGTLRPLQPRQPPHKPSPDLPPDPAAPQPERFRLPKRWGWSLDRACTPMFRDPIIFARGVGNLLLTPEMAPFVAAAAPQLRRLLRPLFRSMCVDNVPAILAPKGQEPAPPRRARAKQPPRTPAEPRPLRKRSLKSYLPWKGPRPVVIFPNRA